jgi:hypothetical protein
MHIGIDARLTYYRTGGISTYIRRLVGALELLDADNRYTVFHSRKAQDSLVTRFITRNCGLAHYYSNGWRFRWNWRFNLDLLRCFTSRRCVSKRHVITDTI